MRRLLLVLVLPLIWFPLIGFLLVMFPALPWYAWLGALGVYVMLWRRRRAAAEGMVDEGSARFSPVAGGGY